MVILEIKGGACYNMSTKKDDKSDEVSKTKGRGKYMAVSKATLPYLKGDMGDRLLKDIESTLLDKEIIKNCKNLLQALAEKRKKHIDE